MAYASETTIWPLISLSLAILIGLIFVLDLPTIARLKIGAVFLKQVKIFCYNDPQTRVRIKMNIGEAAQAAGVNAKFIRYYETRGIIPKASRTDTGYRIYSESDIHILRFVKHTRNLGFSLPEIKKLVSLWRNKTRRSEDVKNITAKHIHSLEIKIREMESIKLALERLAHQCHGDSRPDCPILEDFADSKQRQVKPC